MIRVALIGAKIACFVLFLVSILFLGTVSYHTLTYKPRIEPKPITLENIDLSNYEYPVIKYSLLWEQQQEIINKYRQ